MVKCDECGNDVVGYYKDKGQKLCLSCYQKSYAFEKNSKQKEKVEKQEDKQPSQKQEKWIVLKLGHEEVWTMEKVNKQIEGGKLLAQISFIIAIIAFIIWYWQSYSANLTIYEILSDYFNPLIWICVIFIIIGLFGVESYFSAKNAREVYEVKRKKSNSSS